MIAQFDGFLTQMSPELFGCPDALIKQKLIDAAREFAERTDSLRLNIRLPAREGQRRYPLEADFAADILKIGKVEIDGQKIHDSFWRFMELDGSAEECQILEFSEAAGPLLKNGSVLMAEAILAPKTTCTCVPAKWLDRWSKGIIGYAMAELLGMDGAKWANPNRAVIHAGRYQSATVRARQAVRALDGHENAKGIGV